MFVLRTICFGLCLIQFVHFLLSMDNALMHYYNTDLIDNLYENWQFELPNDRHPWVDRKATVHTIDSSSERCVSYVHYHLKIMKIRSQYRMFSHFFYLCLNKCYFFFYYYLNSILLLPFIFVSVWLVNIFMIFMIINF